jgi:hypothetical protein
MDPYAEFHEVLRRRCEGEAGERFKRRMQTCTDPDFEWTDENIERLRSPSPDDTDEPPETREMVRSLRRLRHEYSMRTVHRVHMLEREWKAQENRAGQVETCPSDATPLQLAEASSHGSQPARRDAQNEDKAQSGSGCEDSQASETAGPNIPNDEASTRKRHIETEAIEEPTNPK